VKVLIWVTMPASARMMGMMRLHGWGAPRDGMRQRQLRQAAGAARRLLVAGSPEGETESSVEKGAGLPVPLQVLFDTLTLARLAPRINHTHQYASVSCL
jgi:hypothetical protein